MFIPETLQLVLDIFWDNKHCSWWWCCCFSSCCSYCCSSCCCARLGLGGLS